MTGINYNTVAPYYIFGYEHNDKKISVFRIGYKKEDSDVRCVKIYFACLTAYHYFS